MIHVMCSVAKGVARVVVSGIALCQHCWLQLTYFTEIIKVAFVHSHFTSPHLFDDDKKKHLKDMEEQGNTLAAEYQISP